MRSPILVTFFMAAITTMAIVNFVAIEFSLYWRYLWLDNPMHILGGVSVALALFVIPLFNIRVPERYFSLISVLLFVFAVGLCWELFEICIGLPKSEPGFAHDAVIDLLMDLVGGLIGYTVGNRIRTL